MSNSGLGSAVVIDWDRQLVVSQRKSLKKWFTSRIGYFDD
jgi:hypothetical protein